MPEGRPDPREMGRYLAIAQVGLEMVAPIALGLVLDHYLGWTPWGIVGGTILGFFGGLAHLLAILKRFEDDGPPAPRQDQTP